MQNFLSLWLNARAQITHGGQIQRPRQILLLLLLQLLLDPRTSHTRYRRQGCAVHRGRENVGREPSWCRPNSEYHYFLCSYLNFPSREWKKAVLMVVSPLWRGLGILSSIQDGGSYRPGWLLLTSPVNPPFPVWGYNGAIALVQPYYFCVRWVE